MTRAGLLLALLLLVPPTASAQDVTCRQVGSVIRCERDWWAVPPGRDWPVYGPGHFLGDFLDAYDRERRLQMDLQRHRQERELLRLQIERLQRQEEWEEILRRQRERGAPPRERAWDPEFRDAVEEFTRRHGR